MTIEAMNYDEMIDQCDSVDDFIEYARNIDAWYRIPHEPKVIKDIFSVHIADMVAQRKRKIAFFGSHKHLEHLQTIDFHNIEIAAFITIDSQKHIWGKACVDLTSIDLSEIDAIFVTSGCDQEFQCVEQAVTDLNIDTQVINLFDRGFFIERVLSSYVQAVLCNITTLPGKKHILYLTYDVIVNVLKQSLYLRKTNEYQTSLIKLGRIRERTEDAIAYEAYFDQAFCLFNSELNYWILAKVLEQAPFDIVYANVYFHTAWLAVFVRQFSGAKVVFELKDTLQTLSREELYRHRFTTSKKRLDLDYDAEKYAYENLDGLVSKDKENYMEFFMEPVSHRIKTLTFRSYSCSEFYNQIETQYSPEQKYRLIFSSSVTPTHIPKEICPTSVLMLEIFKELLEQGLEILAIGAKHRNTNSDWGYLEKQYKNFSLANWHSVQDIVKLQAEFGFGIILFKDEEKQEWGHNVWNIGIGERFYSYLESGLPVIVSDSRKAMCALVRKYEIGIVVNQRDFANLHSIIADCDYEKMRNNVLALRENEINMRNNITRLTEFFEAL